MVEGRVKEAIANMPIPTPLPTPEVVIKEVPNEDLGQDSGNLAYFSFGIVELAWKVSQKVNDGYDRGRI
jgi:hypothetical protein